MVTPELEQRLRNLVDVFLQENSVHNLSAFRDHERCWTGNVEDSLAAMTLPELASLPQGSRFLDLGTGGGFPLLVLAICFPDHAFVGIDSTRKKIDAVGRMAKTMEIQNVELLSGRAEELARAATLRDRFDMVLVRALATLNVLIEYTAPFTRSGGRIIAWKSLQIDQELEDCRRARSELAVKLERSHPYELPGEFGERQLLVLQKTAPTPKKYPRPVGTPKKSPLV